MRASTTTPAWECASGPTVLTSLHSTLDQPTCLRVCCQPLLLSRWLSLLAMAGLGMPQHVHVITLMAAKRVRNEHEQPTRSMRRESTISLVALRAANMTTNVLWVGYTCMLQYYTPIQQYETPTLQRQVS